MYIAVCGAKGHEQVTLRKESRIPGTSKKKVEVIKNYGYLKDCIAQDPDFVNKLRAQIQQDRNSQLNNKKSNIITIPSDTIDTTEKQNRSYRFGHMIVNKIWEIMKLDEFFDKCCTGRKNKAELLKALYFLVAHRLSNPDSVRSTALSQLSFAGVEEVTLDVMYSVFDILADKKDELIEHLSSFFKRNTDRNLDIVCYDVTNYYFESTKQGQLRLFGFSKEHKNNEVLVVMGLLIDSNGIPVTMQIFPGNTMDQNTLEDAVVNLKALYGFREITVIADRGMNSGSNLVFVSGNGNHFIISYTLKKASDDFKSKCLAGDWDTEIKDKDGILEYASKTIKTTIKAKIAMTEEEIAKEKEYKKENKVRGKCRKYKEEEVSCIIHVTFNRKRAEKDASDRQRAVNKLKEGLEKSGFVHSSIHYGAKKYMKINADEKSAELDCEKILEDKKWDGYYAVVTDRTELTTDEVMSLYRSQWKIEESFRILKTDLSARPVYFSTDNHIIGHFVLCYICLCIIRYIQYLQNRKDQNLVYSAERIMQCISEPIVIAAGNYPDCVLIPSLLSEDFINLISFLGFSRLEKGMSPTRFKAVTKLNVNNQLKTA